MIFRGVNPCPVRGTHAMAYHANCFSQIFSKDAMAATQHAQTRITFIGGGNMATSLISGLCQAGHDPACIHAVDPTAAQRERLAGSYAINTHARAGEDGALDVDVVLLAVKP